jgi:hypothetical protein
MMVDFCNPVFSKRRASLLQYVPNAATAGSTDFADKLVAAVNAAAKDAQADGPEHEFLANWGLGDAAWNVAFAGRIEKFFNALEPLLLDVDKFIPIFKLAEARRREFRCRPLAEFPLTTPTTNIPKDAPLLEFTPDGSIRPK